MKTKTVTRALFALGLVTGIAPACGGRPSYWDTPVTSQGTTTSYGLTKGVALVDDGAHRVVVLTAQGDLSLSEQSLGIGHQVVDVVVSPDQARLFVLSAGDWPRRTLNDELPSLTVIDIADDFHAGAHAYPMSEPLGNLAIDPQGHWAVAYAGSSAATSTAPSFVENPNEIVVFDLTNPPSKVTRTLQSFGGTPERLVFTPELQLPGGKGQRRLLLIETDIDLTMLDLDRAFEASPPPEITVPLTSGSSAAQINPAGLAVDGREPTDPNDARFAVWASNDTNVFTLQLVPPTTDLRNDFTPSINLTDVGGIPSDVAFVETQASAGSTAGSLRVAALVPSTSSAVLVDPDTSVTTTVSLPAAYANLSLVTAVVNGTATTPATTDVALLWNAGANATSGVALWSLGNSVTQPYRSIQVLGATQPIRTAIDVPPPNQARKVLQMTSGAGFYVLDLLGRTAPPLTTAGSAALSIAPDGGRIWAFTPSSTELASIDFRTLNPIPLTTDLGISAVYDVARTDGGRALLAMHAQGASGATVFDALNPVTATSRRTGALLVEAP
jgi:hypothetical protein